MSQVLRCCCCYLPRDGSVEDAQRDGPVEDAQRDASPRNMSSVISSANREASKKALVKSRKMSAMTYLARHLERRNRTT